MALRTTGIQNYLRLPGTTSPRVRFPWLAAHEDYQALIAKIDAALEGHDHPEIKALLNTTDMEGWTLRALFDDCKLGLRHGKKFSRAAIYGNKAWFKYAAKIGGLFISGETKYFENYDEALEWVIAPKI
ncbi:MAG TPA: STAS/SEC14 domain-containing protein [Methylococcaceae bacterium]|nr:STAS/SEC14 domain-containing protein [Methylococcaceae bacterium]HIA45156.1 STAS/SEC14 domain-containing protein [Methylococcaceae bacterium]